MSERLEWIPTSQNIAPGGPYDLPFVFTSLDHLTHHNPVYVSRTSGGWKSTTYLALGEVVKITPQRVTVKTGSGEYAYERATGRRRGNAPSIYPVVLENRWWSDLKRRTFLIDTVRDNLQRGFHRTGAYTDEQCLDIAEILNLPVSTTGWPT